MVSTFDTADERRDRGRDRRETRPGAARWEERGEEQMLDAAEPHVSIDWGHYVESRLQDFQRR